MLSKPYYEFLILFWSYISVAYYLAHVLNVRISIPTLKNWSVQLPVVTDLAMLLGTTPLIDLSPAVLELINLRVNRGMVMIRSHWGNRICDLMICPIWKIGDLWCICFKGVQYRAAMVLDMQLENSCLTEGKHLSIRPLCFFFVLQQSCQFYLFRAQCIRMPDC